MPQVTVHGIAAGGDGVGRLPDGRTVFVRGAIPGDRAEVVVSADRPRYARADLVELLDAGPGRVDPACPHVAEGCGGCGWQHVALGTQRELKTRIVTDALTRIGRLAPAALPPVDVGPALPAAGYRTTVRAAVDPTDPEGRLGLRAHRRHAVVPFGERGCPVAHPLVDRVLRTARFPGAREVVVRVGAATGEVLVVVDGVPAGDPPWIHEVVAGHRFRISAGSFFQARPDGAAALVEAVGPAAGTFVDLYAGVGLFAAAAGATADRVVAVESNRSAVADAAVNVPGATIVEADVARWRPEPADTVVADPARAGLGRGAVERIAATGTSRLVLVSCDPGSLGRDAGLLAGAGFELVAATLVDLFPHTPHVEVLTTWTR